MFEEFLQYLSGVLGLPDDQVCCIEQYRWETRRVVIAIIIGWLSLTCIMLGSDRSLYIIQKAILNSYVYTV